MGDHHKTPRKQTLKKFVGLLLFVLFLVINTLLRGSKNNDMNY